MDEEVESRWDPFTLGELMAMAEALEAAYFSDGIADLPLWLDLMDAIDARGAGTGQLREELRASAEEAAAWENGGWRD